MDNRKLFFRVIVGVVVVGAFYRYFTANTGDQQIHITGQTMGAITYNVKYLSESETVSKRQIDSILIAFNQSLSTYIPNSEISQLNKSRVLVNPSATFSNVLDASFQIHQATDGAFDPTVGPIVNAWGFGPDKKVTAPDSASILKLMEAVGLSKVLRKPFEIRLDSFMYLDFSAIAKGYAVDVVANYLKKKELTDFMVEIGGEVHANGVNTDGKVWAIGIEDPIAARDEQKLLAIVRLKDRAIATSGNYRNYYKIGDKIIAHTIDPRTGYNTIHNLLSASVFAKDCMTADAFATAFMVLGVEKAQELVSENELDAFLIFQKEDGSLGCYVSKGLAEFVDLNKINE